MLKYIGITLIIGAGGLLGLIKRRTYSDYVSFLQGLALALDLLETEVRYKQNPLERAFEEIGNAVNHPDVSRLFRSAVEYGAQHAPGLPDQAWKAGIDTVRNKIPKEDPLADYLFDFGQALGRTDLQSQENLFSLLRRQLSQCLERALSKEEKEGRLWQYLGLSGGVILVILLI